MPIYSKASETWSTCEAGCCVKCTELSRVIRIGSWFTVHTLRRTIGSIWVYYQFHTACLWRRQLKECCQHRNTKHRLNKLLGLQYLMLCNHSLRGMFAEGNLRSKMEQRDSESWSWTCLDAHTQTLVSCQYLVVTWTPPSSRWWAIPGLAGWPTRADVGC